MSHWIMAKPEWLAITTLKRESFSMVQSPRHTAVWICQTAIWLTVCKTVQPHLHQPQTRTTPAQSIWHITPLTVTLAWKMVQTLGQHGAVNKTPMSSATGSISSDWVKSSMVSATPSTVLGDMAFMQTMHKATKLSVQAHHTLHTTTTAQSRSLTSLWLKTSTWANCPSNSISIPLVVGRLKAPQTIMDWPRMSLWTMEAHSLVAYLTAKQLQATVQPSTLEATLKKHTLCIQKTLETQMKLCQIFLMATQPQNFAMAMTVAKPHSSLNIVSPDCWQASIGQLQMTPLAEALQAETPTISKFGALITKMMTAAGLNLSTMARRIG